ncbi:14647_t:CDS:2, partial [Ambispora leptoticha]
AGTYGSVKEAMVIKADEKVAPKSSFGYDKINGTRNTKCLNNFMVFLKNGSKKNKFKSMLATGGELFDRMCDRGKFTEADAVEVIKTVLTQTAKFMKDDDDILTTYCSSPGYVDYVVMHRPCNEDPFATTEERNGLRVEFHNRYWRNISSD